MLRNVVDRYGYFSIILFLILCLFVNSLVEKSTRTTIISEFAERQKQQQLDSLDDNSSDPISKAASENDVQLENRQHELLAKQE